MDTTLKISKIKDGTVIDHVPGGMAFKVLSILRVDDLHENSVSIGIRVPSGKMGQKDVIKVENRYLERVEVDKISFVAPEATISIVKNYNITEKYRVELPEKVIGFIRCINPNCISNAREPVSSEFKLVSRAPISIRCEYCERSMSEREILQNL
ncbi:MAG: aspartate carbamoyltransferase regulatory subunit [Candidatus Thermoplasmatota archaeon]|jgi:aspartate carbamoyltransferase regulatory subunit|nr:aspartate carbamoyltransferase regulatory subunit [Candidatus Thermoplasmatota archaeon]